MRFALNRTNANDLCKLLNYNVMALNLAELLILSFIIAYLFKYIKVPPLVGMLFLGIAFGPFVLDWLEPSLLTISSELRMGALIVILLRAGFELSKDTLMKVGRPVLLLSFVPAVLEGTTIAFLGPYFLPLNFMESAILGTVIAAVSPAVVVPLMIEFINKKKGTNKGIPTLILAASSIDDVFVIVIYSILIGIYTGKQVNMAWELASIPISIIFGIGIGMLTGIILYKIFDKYNPHVTKRVLVLLSISIILVHFEHFTKDLVPFAALLSVMTIGYIILKNRSTYAHEVSSQLAKLWIPAEVVLFAMVGAQVNVQVAFDYGLSGIALIFIALVSRSIGSYLSIMGTNLNFKEKMFVVISYIPKATVRAAIGGAPLIAMKATGMDTGPGQTILAMAVLSIIVTAPLGAWAITLTGNHWLTQETNITKIKAE